MCGNCGSGGSGISAHTLPMAIPGMHPLCGSGPQPTMWPPNVTEALRQKRDGALFSFFIYFFIPEKQKAAFCSHMAVHVEVV